MLLKCVVTLSASLHRFDMNLSDMRAGHRGHRDPGNFVRQASGVSSAVSSTDRKY